MNDCKEINKDAVVNKLRTMYTAYMVTGNPTSATLFRDAADLIEQKSCLYERALNDVVRLYGERKIGEWIYDPKDSIEMMFALPKCSVCGHESSDARNYCTSCGARMVTDDV